MKPKSRWQKGLEEQIKACELALEVCIIKL